MININPKYKGDAYIVITKDRGVYGLMIDFTRKAIADRLTQRLVDTNYLCEMVAFYDDINPEAVNILVNAVDNSNLGRSIGRRVDLEKILE